MHTCIVHTPNFDGELENRGKMLVLLYNMHLSEFVTYRWWICRHRQWRRRRCSSGGDHRSCGNSQ